MVERIYGCNPFLAMLRLTAALKSNIDDAWISRHDKEKSVSLVRALFALFDKLLSRFSPEVASDCNGNGNENAKNATSKLDLFVNFF